MKYALVGAVLAASAVAAPSGTRLAERIAKRRAGLTHDPTPFIPAKGKFDKNPVANTSKETDYSSNWSGAVWTGPPNGAFNIVSGYFNVPTPQKPGNAGSGDYAASAWVGIDGDTYGGAILQTGCDFTATDNGPEYDCWYEYFPNPLTDFDGFTPSAGDTIYAVVQSTGSTSGTATLTNTRTGQSVTQQLSAPNAQASLVGQNAEWIVEDFESGGSLVPFANFGTVTFTNCQAMSGGNNVGTSGADIIDITQNNQVITNAQIPSGSEVTVQYTGP